jgi:hypothetical protein
MREFTSAAPQGEEEANPLEGVKFKLDGEVFECLGRASILESSILASAAVADAGEGYSAEAIGAVADFLRMSFGDAEFHRFRAWNRTHGTSDATLLEIMNEIRRAVEENAAEEAERPTTSPSGSSNGQTDPAERTSRIIGLQHGDVTVLPGGAADTKMDPALRQERDEQAAARNAARTGKRKQRPTASSPAARKDAETSITRLG